MYYSVSFSKDKRLEELAKATQFCSLCERMCHRKKVLSKSNGNIDGKILFIAEAPGRLGADRTLVPLYGDKTGDNFEKLLSKISWSRDQIFITNALLCNPRDDNGNNSTPSSEEIRNCSNNLELIINLIQPKVIVTLGRVALESLNYIHPHNISLSSHVAKPQMWKGFILFPLYHPGPRAVIHRASYQQLRDFVKLSKLIDPKKELLLNTSRPHQIQKEIIFSQIHIATFALLESLKEISLFKLNKLLYLIDLTSLKNTGSSMTGEIYLRQKEGPWLPNLKKYLSDMKGFESEVIFKNGKPFVRIGANARIDININNPYLTNIIEIIIKYGRISDSELKTKVYLTRPMRYILTQERLGKNMLNKPVLYKDKAISERDN